MREGNEKTVTTWIKCQKWRKRTTTTKSTLISEGQLYPNRAYISDNTTYLIVCQQLKSKIKTQTQVSYTGTSTSN